MTEQDDQLLQTTNESVQNTLKFRDINLTVGDRSILKDIYGEISSQNILALMGPSGSGKSSLLNVLSFRHEILGKAHPSGSITLNGLPLSKKDRYHIGYVMQEDIFFPTLTLYETLTFYVNLRISNKYSKKEKEDIIIKLAKYMRLEKSMNTVMGGGIIRGLSGGERKRASVACELITNPKILMLDEPTSGLDSFMAASVINILKEYCRTKNKIVIASIHQPSSQTFHCFDHLVLLTCGKQAYEGSTLQVSKFFADCGFICPAQWNMSDYMCMLSLNKIEVVGSDEKSIDKIVNAFKNTAPKQFDDQNINKSNFDESGVLQSGSNERILTGETPHKKWPAGKRIQFQYLIRRNFLLSIEDQLSMMNLTKCVIVSLFLGLVWFDLPWDASHFQDILGLLYYLIVENFSNPFFTGVLVFESEKMVISRERMASMYSLFLYYTSKVLSELPALFIRPLIHTIFVYPMASLAGGPTFLVFFAILSLANIIGMHFGFFLSSMGLRQKETLTLMVIFFIVFNLYGGFFASKMPAWIEWGKYISPLFSLYILLTYSQFDYRPLKCDDKLALSYCANVSVNSTLGVDVILDSQQAGISYYWFIVILFGELILLNILSFFILQKTITKPATGFKICEVCNPVKMITKTYERRSTSSVLVDS